jgi:hypothetical protein
VKAKLRNDESLMIFSRQSKMGAGRDRSGEKSFESLQSIERLRIVINPSAINARKHPEKM